jgi:hypothetical protein
LKATVIVTDTIVMNGFDDKTSRLTPDVQVQESCITMSCALRSSPQLLAVGIVSCVVPSLSSACHSLPVKRNGTMVVLSFTPDTSINANIERLVDGDYKWSRMRDFLFAT